MWLWNVMIGERLLCVTAPGPVRSLEPLLSLDVSFASANTADFVTSAAEEDFYEEVPGELKKMALAMKGLL